MTISGEAVEAAYAGFIAQLKKAGWTSCDSRYIAHEKRAIEAAITALLATGEVVVRESGWVRIDKIAEDGCYAVMQPTHCYGDKTHSIHLAHFSNGKLTGITGGRNGYGEDGRIGFAWKIPAFNVKPPAQKEGV